MLIVIAKVLLISICISLALVFLVLTFLSRTVFEFLTDLEKKIADLHASLLKSSQANLFVLASPLLSSFAMRLLDYFFVKKGKTLFIKLIDVLIMMFNLADSFFKAFANYLRVKKSLKR